MEEITIAYHPIGIIHTPFRTIEDMPIQPSGAISVPGKAEIYPQFAEGLSDLEGFSHIILLYHFHKVSDYLLMATPFLDSRKRGIFATRAPKRPNPVGLSAVRLIKIEGTVLHLENVDMLDQTPLLDIKPFVPEFDCPDAERIGWLEQHKERSKHHKSDSRFR
jgi:tRNA (adenine37-N6)-methyltransferase